MKKEEKNGLFISFEGIDGCGKSSIMKRVNEILTARGYNVYSVREPGGVPISESIRNIIMDNKNTDMDDRCEALLFAAARAQLVHSKLEPLLKEKCILLSDRYVDSSLVYQGYARNLGFDGVMAINNFAMDGLWPDITFLIDIKTVDAQKRMHSDDKHEENRLDVQKLKFYNMVAEAYSKLKSRFPERIKVIDGYQQFEDEAMQIAGVIEAKWIEMNS